MPGTLLCPECAESLEFIDPTISCPNCAAPYGALVCTECLDAQADAGRHRAPSPFPFSAARAAVTYAGPGKALVTAYKDAGEQRLDKTLASLLVQAIRADLPAAKDAPPFMRRQCRDWAGWADALVAIPSRRTAVRQRGFDHLQRIARFASSWLELPLLPALRYAHRTIDQRLLGTEQRMENLRGSFALDDGADVRGKRVILVDDVLTTGATTSAATEALLAGGAAEVRVAVVARVW